LQEISAESDRLSHVYTLILRPDQTYEVRIDGSKKESGNLLEGLPIFHLVLALIKGCLSDWDFLPAKTIKDPSVSKPSDW